MRFGTSPRPGRVPATLRATADFIYERTDDGLVVIIDQDLGGRSVTNDMENVLGDIILKEGLASLAGALVTYRDSQGDWCRVVLSKQGRYEGICSFGKRVTGEAEALELLRQVPR